ncbi:MAG TPA: gamma-glutamyltransferase family protein [Mycobacteriales bacterium]|nr:gamma-glutamyltransferase family protein [Mycobacteriales bacterium]
MTATRPTLVGDFGMAASTHWLASAAAMSVLERGGNAFDAIVAGGFVLQVVEPHLNGPGGEVPIVFWSERDRAVHVVCGQGVAPAAATIDRFTDLGLDLVPGTGLLAAAVPGAFGGWLELLQRWGTWRLRDVLDYAIHYADHGYPVLPGIAGALEAVGPMFVESWPTSAAAWLPGGKPPQPGARLTSPGVAATYQRIVGAAEAAGSDRDAQIDAARDAWYAGFVAAAIDEFCAGRPWPDSSGRAHGGLLTADDLASWHATVELPESYRYGRATVYKTGPWGQGPVFLQQLALLSGFDLDAMGFLSTDYVHTVTECAKLAFADREAWYGDTPRVDGLVARLLADDYNAARRRLVGDTASLEQRPGEVDGVQPMLPPVVDLAEALAAIGTGEPTTGDTCHIDVVDRAGNLVSATPSGGWLQSSPCIPELGFCLGTRMQMFWLTPGLPSSLRPGARPRTTLSPSIAFRDDEPWLAFGTPGGDQQDQWTLQFLLGVIHGDLDLQAAIEAPMFHSDHFPGSFFPRLAQPGRLAVEERLDRDVVEALRSRGHDVAVSGPWSLGRVSAVARQGDVRLAAADPRGSQAYAAGR